MHADLTFSGHLFITYISARITPEETFFVFGLVFIIKSKDFDVSVSSSSCILQMKDLFKSNLTFCVVCVFTLRIEVC
jgi:hypothetical protein